MTKMFVTEKFIISNCSSIKTKTITMICYRLITTIHEVQMADFSFLLGQWI